MCAGQKFLISSPIYVAATSRAFTLLFAWCKHIWLKIYISSRALEHVPGRQWQRSIVEQTIKHGSVGICCPLSLPALTVYYTANHFSLIKWWCETAFNFSISDRSDRWTWWMHGHIALNLINVNFPPTPEQNPSKLKNNAWVESELRSSFQSWRRAQIWSFFIMQRT